MVTSKAPIEQRQVVGIDADHVADQHAGHAGNVVVGAVDHHGQPIRDLPVDRGADSGLLLLLDELASTQQHQTVDDLASPRCGQATVQSYLGLGLGIRQVPCDGCLISRGAGDQRIERSTPGIHGVWNEVDLFERDLRLVGHGGVPQGRRTDGRAEN